MPREVVFDALVDLRAYERVIEQRRPYADRRSTGNQKFDGIICRGDAALPDDRHVVRAGNFVNLLRLQEGNRFDGRTGQAAAHVADDGLSLLDIDGHTHQRIDDSKRVGAGLDTQACVFGDVGLVGR